MARRFPKVDMLHGGRDHEQNPAMSVDVLSDFFDHFQPMPIESEPEPCDAAVASKSLDLHDAHHRALPNAPTPAPTPSDSEWMSIASTSADIPTHSSAPFAIRQTSTATTESDTAAARRERGDVQRDGVDELRGEVAMLRHLFYSELREANHSQGVRHAQLTDAVNEAVRLAVALEGRLDDMRLSASGAREARPCVVLAGTVADAVATVFLFVIAVFVARPLALLKWCFERVRGRGAGERKGDGGSVKRHRMSRGWRLSGRDFDDPFLGTVAKRISFSAATTLND